MFSPGDAAVTEMCSALTNDDKQNSVRVAIEGLLGISKAVMTPFNLHLRWGWTELLVFLRAVVASIVVILNDRMSDSSGFF